MTNILNKPYLGSDYAEFAIEANKNGQRIEQDDRACYALLPAEILQDGQIVDISQTPEYLAQQLEDAKEAKLAENKQKREARIVAGVEYEGVLFDSDTDSKLNISVQLSQMNDTDTVVWKGMNNDRVLFTKQDFANLAGVLKKLTSDIWGDGGLDDKYTKAISDAPTLGELEAIEIDYSQI